MYLTAKERKTVADLSTKMCLPTEGEILLFQH
jgi:hypothetical protein